MLLYDWNKMVPKRQAIYVKGEKAKGKLLLSWNNYTTMNNLNYVVDRLEAKHYVIDDIQRVPSINTGFIRETEIQQIYNPETRILERHVMFHKTVSPVTLSLILGAMTGDINDRFALASVFRTDKDIASLITELRKISAYSSKGITALKSTYPDFWRLLKISEYIGFEPETEINVENMKPKEKDKIIFLSRQNQMVIEFISDFRNIRKGAK